MNFSVEKYVSGTGTKDRKNNKGSEIRIYNPVLCLAHTHTCTQINFFISVILVHLLGYCSLLLCVRERKCDLMPQHDISI